MCVFSSEITIGCRNNDAIYCNPRCKWFYQYSYAIHFFYKVPIIVLINFHQYQTIENYLIEHNADRALLAERENLPTGLPKLTRCFLINHLADHLVSVYGLTTVKKEQMLQFCKEVIVLFPSLSLKNGDDTDTVSRLSNKLNNYYYSTINKFSFS